MVLQVYMYNLTNLTTGPIEPSLINYWINGKLKNCSEIKCQSTTSRSKPTIYTNQTIKSVKTSNSKVINNKKS